MRRLMNAFSALLILALIGLGIMELQRFQELEKMNNDIREMVVMIPEKDDPSGADPDDPFERRIDFDTLQSINPDIKGWIYIPGTKIDYPILTGESNEIYLNRNLYGQYSSLGSVFTYAGVNLQDDSLVRIYGHNMITKQMFANVADYSSQEFADSHAVMYIYTPGRTKECHLVSAFGCRYNDRVFKTVTEDIETYANELIRRSEIETQEQEFYRQIYTLGTCRGYLGTPNRYTASFSVVKEKFII